MSTSSSENEAGESSYVIDSESPEELARLLHQDRFFTKALGLLPVALDTTRVRSILDLACGPGGWARDAATMFPSAQVTGVDISQRVVQFAQDQVEILQLPNVRFTLMNILNPLDFPDNSFDLIHGRLLVGSLTLDDWPPLLQECKRILRPGGVLCLTESEWGISNGPVSECFKAFLMEALYRVKHSISPSEEGTTVMLQPFLRRAGYQNVQAQAHFIEFSAGTEWHHAGYQDMMAMVQLLQPFLVSVGVATQEELNQLYQRLPAEMLSNDFCQMFYFLRAWGEK